MSGFVVDKRKIAIIGAGYVGASIAYALTLKDIAGEIVLMTCTGSYDPALESMSHRRLAFARAI